MTESSPANEGFRRAAWAFVVYVVFVIAWGAYVRVSFSGDGCGDHWPDCNGAFVPAASSAKQTVEYVHRVTSGLCGVFSLSLLIAAVRRFPRRHPTRFAAGAALFFMVTEALLGAALVKLRMVGTNTSIARAYWSAGHLVNTFALLFFVTRTAVTAGGVGRFTTEGRSRIVAQLAFAFFLLVLVGMTGTVAALGDTLFPSQSFGAGFVADFDPRSHPFLQLRAFHPLFALGSAAWLSYAMGALLANDPEPAVGRAVRAVLAIVLLQVVIGFANLAWAAPAPMQIAHLVAADALWIALTTFASIALDPRTRAHT